MESLEKDMVNYATISIFWRDKLWIGPSRICSACGHSIEMRSHHKPLSLSQKPSPIDKFSQLKKKEKRSSPTDPHWVYKPFSRETLVDGQCKSISMAFLMSFVSYCSVTAFKIFIIHYLTVLVVRFLWDSMPACANLCVSLSICFIVLFP